jgi:AcrR family transcriptional regulator
MEHATTDHRRATAERNVEAILDAAERLLQRHAPVSISAVAAEAGLSRVTVYAHFRTLDELLEAVVGRAVRRASTALDTAELETGAPLDALDRLIKVSWRELEQHNATARAAAEELSPDAMSRTHDPARRRIRRLVDRGRTDGTFRSDMPAEWLATSSIALMHAAVDEVRAGRLSATTAREALLSSIRDLWVGVAR